MDHDFNSHQIFREGEGSKQRKWPVASTTFKMEDGVVYLQTENLTERC